MLIQNERTKQYKKVKVGFSWTSLFFGIFVPIFRGDLKGFVFQVALALITFGISWLVVPFMYNKRYLNRMLEDGWVVVE